MMFFAPNNYEQHDSALLTQEGYPRQISLSQYQPSPQEAVMQADLSSSMCFSDAFDPSSPLSPHPSLLSTPLVPDMMESQYGFFSPNYETYAQKLAFNHPQFSLESMTPTSDSPDHFENFYPHAYSMEQYQQVSPVLAQFNNNPFSSGISYLSPQEMHANAEFLSPQEMHPNTGFFSTILNPGANSYQGMYQPSDAFNPQYSEPSATGAIRNIISEPTGNKSTKNDKKAASMLKKTKKVKRNQDLKINTEKMFKCDICPQAFLRANCLKRHHLIHLAVRPFECTWCNKSFYRKDLYRRHLGTNKCRRERLHSLRKGKAETNADLEDIPTKSS